MKEKLIESIILEELKKSDVVEIAKHDRDFEKRIREIVSDVVVEMFRVLWQHSAIFKALGK